MKVSNNKIGGAAGNAGLLDTGKADKAGRTDALGLKKDIQADGLSKANLKGSSNVNVSERAQMMAKAKEIASQPMSVDEAKVARLQKMIDEGTYRVDADKIADRLVEEHLTIPD